MSSLTIRELITVWGFHVDDKALDSLDKRLEKLQSTVKYVGGLAIGAAGAMFGLATSAGEAGASIKHASERIGISTDALQEYEYAARLAGQSNEGFQGSLQTLTKNLFDARRGLGSSREAFYLLGNVLGKDLLAKGRTSEQILNDVADGLDRVADPSRKLELAGQLFGGDAGAMLTTLKGGSAVLARLRNEARATGVVMSAAAVEAADGYRRNLERLKSTMIGLKNTIGVALFPLIGGLTSRFQRWIAANRAWIALRAHEAFDTLATYIQRVLFIAERVGSVVNTAAIAFGGWGRVLKFVTTAMAVLLALRIVSTVGAFTQVVITAAKAFQFFGNAAMLANLEILAIGAAVVGLLLILEDVVAFFQGRKSITGLLVNDFKGSGDAIGDYIGKALTNAADMVEKFAKPLIEKAKDLGKRAGRAIVDGLSNLTEADFKTIGDVILKALVLIGKATMIPFQIGLSIADGIVEGLIAGIKAKFPTLATALGLGDDAGGKDAAPGGEKPWYRKAIDSVKGFVDSANANMGTKLPGDANYRYGLDDTPAPPVRQAAPASGPGSAASVFQIDARQTINVPSGTPTEKIAPMSSDALKETLHGVLRETGRATSSAVNY